MCDPARKPADRHQDRTVAGTKLRVKETGAHPWTNETLVEGREVTVRRALGGGRSVELEEFPGTVWRRDRFEDSPSSPRLRRGQKIVAVRDTESLYGTKIPEGTVGMYGSPTGDPGRDTVHFPTVPAYGLSILREDFEAAPLRPPLRSGQKIVAVRDTESLFGKKIPEGTVGTYGSAVAFADPSAARAVVTFPAVANYGLSVARADIEPYVEPLRPALAHLPVRPADPGPVIRTSDGTVVLSPSRPPVLYARQDQTDARFEGLARELRAAKEAVEEQGRAIEKLLSREGEKTTAPPELPSVEELAAVIVKGTTVAEGSWVRDGRVVNGKAAATRVREFLKEWGFDV